MEGFIIIIFLEEVQSKAAIGTEMNLNTFTVLNLQWTCRRDLKINALGTDAEFLWISTQTLNLRHFDFANK